MRGSFTCLLKRSTDPRTPVYTGAGALWAHSPLKYRLKLNKRNPPDCLHQDLTVILMQRGWHYFHRLYQSRRHSLAIDGSAGKKQNNKTCLTCC